jgi:aldehyde:ferredoxin oxidoreductase
LLFIDLTVRISRFEEANPKIYSDFIGGRGVQAYLMFNHVQKIGSVKNPLNAENRIIIGSAAPNDTPIPTAGRGSCTFIGTMARSPEKLSFKPSDKPLYGLLTHSSIGGLFPNMLKRAGIDHVVIDGKAKKPVRVVIMEGDVKIVDAEDDLFEKVEGSRVVQTASKIIDFLSDKYKGSSTLCTGPAGWNLVDFACLTGDYHRNFGRGGAGAVFGSKNLVAITVYGKEKISPFEPEKFKTETAALDSQILADVNNKDKTVSFRPATGTTWWLDRAFYGGYLGREGGYLPWHNFDEGSFGAADYAKISTSAFLEIAGKHKVCNRCRHIFCTRSAEVTDSPYAGAGVRPEFETIALWINCCILDRDAMFHMNYLCNELGVDTMTFGSVIAAAMELTEKGLLTKFESGLNFGNARQMISTLKAIAYRSTLLGRLLSHYSDHVISGITSGLSHVDIDDVVDCVTTSFGGLGYAGVEPKAFPGMFTAYGTSNRGRGDHTYAWTVQAEESGLKGEKNLANYVAEGQYGKALVDSLGLCDFFTGDITSGHFLSLYHALTGFDYSKESMVNCGRRIYTLERYVNNLQGRDRNYDAYVPKKFATPLSCGAHKGHCIDKNSYELILDHYYERQGFTRDGIVKQELLTELGILE